MEAAVRASGLQHLIEGLAVGAALLCLGAEQADAAEAGVLLAVMGFALARFEQREIFIAIGVPADDLFRVHIEELFGRGEREIVLVFCPGELRHKEREVLFLGEAAELRLVVQADVEHEVGVHLTEPLEKRRGSCLIGT